MITIRGPENEADSDSDTASIKPLYDSPAQVSEDGSQETPSPMGNPSPEYLEYQNIVYHYKTDYEIPSNYYAFN